jgi:hypothetical protein
VIFILDVEVLLQDTQGKFYEKRRVSSEVIKRPGPQEDEVLTVMSTRGRPGTR